jgi:hypothetical protein
MPRELSLFKPENNLPAGDPSAVAPGQDAPAASPGNQAKPRRPRATAMELRERTSFLVSLVENGVSSKRALKDALRKQFGPMSARTCERCLQRLQAALREALQEPAELQAARAIAFYQRVASDVSVEMRDRLRARIQLDRLLGLEKALQVEHSGAVTLNTGIQEALQQILASDPDGIRADRLRDAAMAEDAAAMAEDARRFGPDSFSNN